MGAGAVFGTLADFWYSFPHIELICQVLIQKEVILLQLDMPDFIDIQGGLALFWIEKEEEQIGTGRGQVGGDWRKVGRGKSGWDVKLKKKLIKK